MSNSEEFEPLSAGSLPIRESVKESLYALRHFERLSDTVLDFQHELKAPALELELIEDVERALECCLPYEILACFANHDGVLAEEGFRLGEVAQHTELARQRGCSGDMIAVGCHPDFHAFYCISNQGRRSRAVQLMDLDNFDGSQRWFDLADWLAEIVERRRDFWIDDLPQLNGWSPSASELAEFRPSLEA